MPPGKPDPVRALLEALPTPEERDFSAILQAIHRSKFTGSILIHWHCGVPRQFDFGPPMRLAIVQPLDSQMGDPPQS